MTHNVVIRPPDYRRHVGDLLDGTFIEWKEKVWIVCKPEKGTITIKPFIGMGTGAEYLHPNELVRPLRLVEAIFE